MSTTIELEFPMTVRIPGAAATAHSSLTGLPSGDDHPQYHNDARGDARYSPLGHTHTSLASVDITTLRIALGNGQFIRLVPVIEDGKPTIQPVLE